MSELPKRHWFQIHLSTAVVLMLGAAALLGLNFLRKEKVYSEWARDGQSLRVFSVTYGWPFPIVYDAYYEGPKDLTVVIEGTGRDRITGQGIYMADEPKRPRTQDDLAPLKDIDFTHAAYNAAVYAAILFVLAQLIEFFIRRREARKS